MGAFHILLQVIEYIASWFVHPDNKTGCRFIVVDAYNKENVLHFYEKNGISPLQRKVLTH